MPLRRHCLDLSFEEILVLKPSKVDLSIVVPAHNEEENIYGIISDIENVISNIVQATEMIIVSDHSADETLSLAARLARDRPWLRVVSNDETAGMGNAIKKGVISSRGAYFAVVMADRVCDVTALPRMLEMAQENDLDIVIGSRFMDTSRILFAAPWRYRVSSTIFRLVSKPIFAGITDPTHAFRLVRRKFWDVIPPRAGDFSISPENTLIGIRSGARIGEYPTKHGIRQRGKSSFKFSKMGIVYVRLLIRAMINRKQFSARCWRHYDYPMAQPIRVQK